ncbi:MAG: phosphoenolpyruvate---glycerone phosphotransferase subunit DhaL [Verrucomicrobiota bacterium]|jgi:dihydroxyacetone kinase-like protein|nr:phosphoenolpyruvate---glycerone phosphotransferase subunit DhaL [Verrucomicrobiota bacterium]MDK2964318.1 phosphoenolpyruvate---glycerone phosphotransferase subunit DhaL [Verrucomicrobiota bacterium]
MVGLEEIISWLKNFRQRLEANKDYLTRLDSAIGDADHGMNMCRGFNAAVAEIEEKNPANIAEALKSVSMILIKKVGGASGPLYGTFFLKASGAAKNAESLNADGILEIFKAGVEGIQLRGKARLGDKTMLDAWFPALEAMENTKDSGVGPMIQAAAAAAEKGMKATIPLIARKGRASYLGERSKGHQDPGATSTCLLLQAAAELWS